MKTRNPWVRHLRFKVYALCAVVLLGQALFIHPALATEKDPRFSVISRSPGKLDLFVVDRCVILMRSWTGSVWTSWRNLGIAANGDCFYTVSAVAAGNNRWDIFSTTGFSGNNPPAAPGQIWHKSFDGFYEYGWEGRGTVESGFSSGIQAVSAGNGRIDLFNRWTTGPVGTLWKSRKANGIWTPCDTCAWTVLDTNTPWDEYSFSALAHSGRINLFRHMAITNNSVPDNRISNKPLNITTNFYVQNHWLNMNGYTKNTPYAVSWGTNRVDVFVRGTDNNVHLNSSDDAGVNWYGWWFLGRGATDNTNDTAAVSAVAWGPNRLDVFTREATTVYHKAWTGTNWWPGETGWENLGSMPSYVLGHPPLPISWGPNRIDLFYYHATPGGAPNTMTLYHKWTDGFGWGPSQTGWESLGPN